MWRCLKRVQFLGQDSTQQVFALILTLLRRYCRTKCSCKYILRRTSIATIQKLPVIIFVQGFQMEILHVCACLGYTLYLWKTTYVSAVNMMNFVEEVELVTANPMFDYINKKEKKHEFFAMWIGTVFSRNQWDNATLTNLGAFVDNSFTESSPPANGRKPSDTTCVSLWIYCKAKYHVASVLMEMTLTLPLEDPDTRKLIGRSPMKDVVTSFHSRGANFLYHSWLVADAVPCTNHSAVQLIEN